MAQSETTTVEVGYKFIYLACGYVENAKVSWMIFDSLTLRGGQFKSMARAITELALDMYHKFYDDYMSTYCQIYNTYNKDCCVSSIIKNRECKECTQCGLQLLERPFDSNLFMQYITNLHGETANEYGGAEYTSGRNLVWWPWSHWFIGASKEEVICIPEYGELVLLHALLDAKPDLGSNDGDYPTDWERYYKQEKQPGLG